jgi:hypothetical protein
MAVVARVVPVAADQNSAQLTKRYLQVCDEASMQRVE